MKEYEEITIDDGKIKTNQKLNYLITVETKQYDMSEISLIDKTFNDNKELEIPDTADCTTYKIMSEASIEIKKGQLSIFYDESKLTGFENTSTQIQFNTKSPDMVTITKTGGICTSLVIENGKRHICMYETPLMQFEISTYGIKLTNNITKDGGTLIIDYIVEIHGAVAEHTILKLRAKRK